jgi:hypothetical protein
MRSSADQRDAEGRHHRVKIGDGVEIVVEGGCCVGNHTGHANGVFSRWRQRRCRIECRVGSVGQCGSRRRGYRRRDEGRADTCRRRSGRGAARDHRCGQEHEGGEQLVAQYRRPVVARHVRKGRSSPGTKARAERPRTPGARPIPRTERSARCGAGGGDMASRHVPLGRLAGCGVLLRRRKPQPSRRCCGSWMVSGVRSVGRRAASCSPSAAGRRPHSPPADGVPLPS